MSQRNGSQAPAAPAPAPAAAPSPAAEPIGAGTGESAPVAQEPVEEAEAYGEDIPF